MPQTNAAQTIYVFYNTKLNDNYAIVNLHIEQAKKFLTAVRYLRNIFGIYRY